MPAFDVPGLEFFATTVEYQVETEFRNYDFVDDSLDGRITLSSKGVHFAPRYL